MIAVVAIQADSLWIHVPLVKSPCTSEFLFANKIPLGYYSTCLGFPFYPYYYFLS